MHIENDRPVTVVTHHRRFHADDVAGCAILSLIYGSRLRISRLARGDSRVDSFDYKLDIGQKHDPENGYFDHHQPDGAGKRPASFNRRLSDNVPYATAGLVWKHFGLALCDNNQAVYNLVEDKLIAAIDASDVGMRTNLRAEGLSASERVANRNGDDLGNHNEQLRRFVQVMQELAEDIRALIAYGQRTLVRQRVVEDAIYAHLDKDEKVPQVLKLPITVDQWRDPQTLRLLSQHGVKILLMPCRENETLVHMVDNHYRFPPSWRGLTPEGQKRLLGTDGHVVFTNDRHARVSDMATADRVAQKTLEGMRFSPIFKAAHGE